MYNKIMSYIGRLPIKIPSGVNIQILNNNTTISIEGPYGSKRTSTIEGISYKYIEETNQILVVAKSPKFKNFWGLARTLLSNHIQGVSRGFRLTLNLVGVGYKVQLGQSVDGQPLPTLEAKYKEKYGDNFKNHLNKYLEGKDLVQNLTLKLGFSHDIYLDIPEGVTVICPKYSSLTLEGNQKDVLSQFASQIKSYRLPEPYKGKGILFKDEIIRRKQGKN